MSMPPLRPAGFTLLELVVVVCIVALLGAVALERYLYLAELAEAAMVEQNIQAMKAGLRMAIARALIQGRPVDSLLVTGHNPIQWVEEPMRGYLGEFPAAELPQCRGCWFYDATRQQLHYRPRLKRYFQSEEGESTVRLWVHTQENGQTAVNTLAEAAWPQIKVAPYQWF